MKKFFFVLCLIPMLFAFQAAEAAKCKFQAQRVDPVTGEAFRQTNWDTVASIFSAENSSGSISAIADGDKRFLAVRFDVIDYYTFPDQLRAEAVATMDEDALEKYQKKGAVKRFKAEIEQLEGPPENQNYRDFLDFLLGESLFVPAGATLRLTLGDQSTLVLSTSERTRERANYTEPYKEKKGRGASGLFAKIASAALDASVGGETVVSPDYMIDGTVSVPYLLDAEALGLLSSATVTSMRIEGRDKYYTLGTRNTRYETLQWSAKSNNKIQDALKCVE
jgi:hypothetical protein